MDKEFHYYLTYLIAARAGFQYDDALTIAQACQAVDDNTRIRKISPDTPHAYSNYISQTMYLLKPRAGRMRIYPVFHFIPGDPDLPSAKRSDQKKHILTTTPDSFLANQCFDRSAETNDLMQIGIAAHAYADTWAHQNFVGYKDEFNGFKGMVNAVIPDIGHADAKHQPDIPDLVWEDIRLIKANRTVKNKKRFLMAAKRLYEKFCDILNMNPDSNDYDAMLNDFDITIGRAKRDSNKCGKAERIDRYYLLSERPEYNSRTIPEFDFENWRKDAIDIRSQLNEDGQEETIVEWKSTRNYKQTKWYLFQEAIKSYQKRTLDIYQSTVYSELPRDLLEKIMTFA